MPTIAEQLTQLQQDRDDLVDNLTTKGIEDLTGEETFTELVPKVLDIPSGGGKYTPNAVTFRELTVTNLDYEIANLDTSNMTDMNYMFYSSRVQNLDVSSFNTNRVTSMALMFSGASSTTINVSGFDMRNVSNIARMFSSCYSLTSIIGLDNFNLSNLDLCQNTFAGCDNLDNNTLNSILKMLTTAVKVTINKNLRYLGLSGTQATTCTTLSNYQDFLDAGWTTGY